MSLLDFDDTYKPPFKPQTRFRAPTEEENFSALQNLGHEILGQEDLP